jgi:methylated-DNA-[protein]-cysteine S-methyltransferase
MRFPGAREASPPPPVAEAILAIERMLEGEKADLSEIALDLEATTDFEDMVYAAARDIPCGEVRTYGEIAQAIGEPGAARAVGAALGRNPVPIVIPCHRVLGSHGKSGGFSAPGGAATKFRMLEIEGARRPGDPELFESLPLAVKPA